MNKEKILSTCCKAEVKTECADEGTCCYICQKCEGACLIISMSDNKMEADFKKLEK